MIEIKRKVIRRTRGAYPVLYRHPEPIVVSFDVGDLLTFRAARRRGVWTLPIDAAFRYAVRLKVLQDAAEKRRAMPARKGRR